MIRFYLIAALVFFFSPISASLAESGRAAPQISSGSQDFNNPLKVKGQTRRLNMLLNLKGSGDEIKFIRLRKNYRKEIFHTQY